MTQSKIRDIGISVLLYGFLITLSLFMILPFIWMLSTSFKVSQEVFGIPPRIIPENPTWENYRYLIQDQNLLRIVWNTFFVAGVSTGLRLFFCSLAGFAFAKYKFPGRGILFAVLLATMIVPPAVTLVPVYVILRELSMIDTLWSLIIPGAANAFGIFFLRQYIRTVHNDLLDAARIDGATEFGIYWRVILPVISPGLVSLGMIFFMGAWNDYFGPLIFLKSPENFTLPLAIFSFQGAVGLTSYNTQMAMAVVSILPLLVVFIMFQRRFVEGITAGAVK